MVLVPFRSAYACTPLLFAALRVSIGSKGNLTQVLKDNGTEQSGTEHHGTGQNGTNQKDGSRVDWADSTITPGQPHLKYAIIKLAVRSNRCDIVIVTLSH